jgi:hypothetical protein
VIGGRSMSAPDPFAFGGRQDDADTGLYRLIAEYHGIVDAYNATKDDSEGSRLLDAMRPILGKINAFRPTTLCGVMAALNFADECDEDPASVGPRARLRAFARS